MVRKKPNSIYLVSSIMSDSFLSMLQGGSIDKINYMEIMEKCAKCRKAKTSGLCTHVRGYQSSTFSESRSQVLAELYRLCRAEEIMNQELYSIVEGSKTRFNIDDIERFIVGTEEDLKTKIRILEKSPLILSADLTGCGESDQVYCLVGIDLQNRPVVSFYLFIYLFNCPIYFFFIFSLSLSPASLHRTLRD
jgi:hypothetical protein